MVWFKVDDNLAFHRKTVAAGNAAMGLWVRAGSWCAQQLTDGFVPEDIAATLGTPTQARRLVDVRLWERVPGGFSFHSWNVPGRQPTSREVLDRRQKEADKKREWREAKKQKEHVNGTSPYGTDDGLPEGHPEGLPQGVRSTRPDPTRPDPTLRSSSGSFGEGTSGEQRANAAQRPPDRCAQHANNPDAPNCGRCAGARKAAERWDAQQAEAQVLDGLAARTCPHCDAEGWRWDPTNRQRGPFAPGVRCDHTPWPADRIAQAWT